MESIQHVVNQQKQEIQAYLVELLENYLLMENYKIKLHYLFFSRYDQANFQRQTDKITIN